MANGTRSGLFFKTTPGGMPSVIDVARYPGSIYWVDSSNTDASDTEGFGSHPDAPCATINYAVGICEASKGDLIIAMPGHVESVIAAAGLVFNKAGVTVEFQGSGSNKATIQFGTDVGADMDVTAANVSLIGPRFLAAIDALTGPIHIAAADCLIKNAEWYDAATKATTDCVVATAAASRLVIDGWKYFESTAGTQKQSHIQVGAAADVALRNIWISGDFETGNIENGTAWSDCLIADVVLENTNATPKPGIALAATATGNVVNAKVTIASGTVPVTAANEMQWYDSAYSTTDGAAWGTIGSVLTGSLEDKVDTILVDTTAIKASAADAKIDAAAVAVDPVANSLGRFIYSGGTARGTPLADSKSLVDALGTNGTTVADSATSVLGAVGANNANNAYLSDAIVANADGSVLERQEYVQDAVDAVKAVTDALPDAGALTALVGDVGDIKAVTDALPNAGALTTIGGNVTAVKAVTDVTVAALGTNGATITDDARSVLGAIGANNANNAFVSPLVTADADGSTLERLEYVQEQVGTLVNTAGTATIGGILGDVANVTVATSLAKLGTITNTGGVATLGAALGDVATVDLVTRLDTIDGQADKVDSATLAVDPVAGSLARFVASGGTALGTPLADSKSLVDALGTNGTAVTDSAVSVLGAVGADNANNAFASSAVVANADGSVLERQEYTQDQVALVKAATDLVGVLVNTGGTATLTAILGDVANINMAARLDSATKTTTIADGTTIPNNTQAAAGLLATATNGDCYIEEIVWQRATDNFVGPTNYEFSTDNVAGLTGASGPNGVAALIKFNANVTGVLSLDGTTKQVPFVLESGKKLYIHGDDAVTSGGGSTNFYIKYRRMVANAYLA